MPGATVRQAVILAGGRGTRLGQLTNETPKPLLACAGRPFIGWIIRELCRVGVEEVLLLTGYLGDLIEAALPDIFAGLPRTVAVRCVREAAPAGTGGALRQAAGELDSRFLLCNGDSWFDFNIAKLLSDAAKGAPGELGRLVLRRAADAGRCGVAECESGRVTAFHERPAGQRPGLVNAGVYLFDRRVLDLMAPVCSLERDVLPRLAAGGSLFATEAEGYFIDIGVPEDLARARAEMPDRLNRKALLLDRDAVIGPKNGWSGGPEPFTFMPGALTAIRAAAEAGWHVFVFSNQPGITNTVYDEAVCNGFSRWMGNHVHAAGGTIDDLSSCLFHPEAANPADHPDGDARLQQTSMLRELLAKWQLNPARCRLVSSQHTCLAAAPCGIPGYLLSGGDLAAFIAPLLTSI